MLTICFSPNSYLKYIFKPLTRSNYYWTSRFDTGLFYDGSYISSSDLYIGETVRSTDITFVKKPNYQSIVTKTMNIPRRINEVAAVYNKLGRIEFFGCDNS